MTQKPTSFRVNAISRSNELQQKQHGDYKLRHLYQDTYINMAEIECFQIMKYMIQYEIQHFKQLII